MRITLASVVTIIGFAIGVVGVLAFPHPVCVLPLGVSIVLDIADGRIARAFDACTREGALLDWWADVLIANALVIAMMRTDHLQAGTTALGIALGCQLATALNSYFNFAINVRMSGRVFTSIVAAWVVFHG